MGLTISGGGAPATGSVTRKQLSSLASRHGWEPTGAIAETLPRSARLQDAQTVNSGVLFLQGGIVVPGGTTVTSISFMSAAASVTPTAQWFCLVDKSLNVLAKTVDDTSTAWGANASKTLNLSATYTPAADIEVYVGAVQVAATPATLRGVVNTGQVFAVAPIYAGTSTTGLTNPASLGGTAGAITGVATACWAWIS